MPSNAFEFFIGRTNSDVVQLLEQNHDVSRVIMGLLQELVTFARDKGVPFHRVRLHDAHVVPTDAGYAQVQARFIVQ